MTRVSLAGRARDGVALALLVAGVATHAFGTMRMRDMGAGRITLPPGQSYVARTERYEQVTRAGIAAIVAGLGVGVWSYRRQRKHPAPPQP